jgi:hypothetical protein
MLASMLHSPTYFEVLREGETPQLVVKWSGHGSRSGPTRRADLLSLLPGPEMPKKAQNGKPATAAKPVTPTEAIPVVQAHIKAHIKRIIENAATYAILYSNDTQVQVSPWDVRIIFGELSSPPSPEPNQEVLVKMTGEVRMSPQHAKRLVQILAASLATYEQQLGPLPMPKD